MNEEERDRISLFQLFFISTGNGMQIRDEESETNYYEAQRENSVIVFAFIMIIIYEWRYEEKCIDTQKRI